MQLCKFNEKTEMLCPYFNGANHNCPHMTGEAQRKEQARWDKEAMEADREYKPTMEQTVDALDHFTAVDASRGARGDGPSRFFIDLLNRGEALVDGVVKMKEK